MAQSSFSGFVPLFHALSFTQDLFYSSSGPLLVSMLLVPLPASALIWLVEFSAFRARLTSGRQRTFSRSFPGLFVPGKGPYKRLLCLQHILLWCIAVVSFSAGKKQFFFHKTC